MIVPKLPEFLQGKYEPQDNDERLALLGICQFSNRSRTAARLYADAFGADATLADNFKSGIRYQAACQAALAGCGRGIDAASLDEQERRIGGLKRRTGYDGSLLPGTRPPTTILLPFAIYRRD